MILDLKDIFACVGETLVYEETIDLHMLDIGGFFPFQKPVTASAILSNKSGIVTVSGAAVLDYVTQCDRCAADINTKMNLPVHHILVSEINDEENYDEDFILIENMLLDITELVTSDILLQLPSKFLCSEHCKGLCASCGVNLNETDCKCDKAVDPRLEALKKLLN
ncbi:MAG: hypothetical protein BGN88_03235 [Clostridiales bacterium 43-6]|nr:MAG: hypothetical protein BGN88_03235 [Clostridiales bacterium 43-6]